MENKKPAKKMMKKSSGKNSVEKAGKKENAKVSKDEKGMKKDSKTGGAKGRMPPMKDAMSKPGSGEKKRKIIKEQLQNG